MKSRRVTYINMVVIFAALAFSVRLPAQEQQKIELKRYTVEDLSTLGGTFSLAGGINNRGEIEGFSTLPGDTAIHAFLWRKGVMIDLGTLGGPNSQASFRPSENGRVGGSSDTSTPDPEDFCSFGTGLICLPFVWQEGVMTPLPTLGGNNGVANGFNSRNQTVGQAQNTTPDETCAPFQLNQAKPVIWEADAIEELPTVSGDPDGDALAINDRGQVVGFSGNCPTTFHAVLWQNGTATDLGNLGGTTGHHAIDINNQGKWSVYQTFLVTQPFTPSSGKMVQ